MPGPNFNFDPFTPSFERPEFATSPEKRAEFAIPLAPAIRRNLLIDQQGRIQQNSQSGSVPLMPPLFKVFEP